MRSIQDLLYCFSQVKLCQNGEESPFNYYCCTILLYLLYDLFTKDSFFPVFREEEEEEEEDLNQVRFQP